jgi:hypothetical protein
MSREELKSEKERLKRIIDGITENDLFFLNISEGPRHNGSKYQTVVISIEKSGKVLKSPKVDIEDMGEIWDNDGNRDNDKTSF